MVDLHCHLTSQTFPPTNELFYALSWTVEAKQGQARMEQIPMKAKIQIQMQIRFHKQYQLQLQIYVDEFQIRYIYIKANPKELLGRFLYIAMLCLSANWRG